MHLQACTFLARCDFKKPSSRLAYTICDSVKPKARENVSAEVRLRRFSLTVLDSSCGMVSICEGHIGILAALHFSRLKVHLESSDDSTV